MENINVISAKECKEKIGAKEFSRLSQLGIIRYVRKTTSSLETGGVIIDVLPQKYRQKDLSGAIPAQGANRKHTKNIKSIKHDSYE